MMRFLTCMNYNNLDTEKATVAYLDILSLQSDSKETILHILDQLHNTFIVDQKYDYLLVAADAKLFDIYNPYVKNMETA